MPLKQNGLLHQPISAFSTTFLVRSSSKDDDDNDDHKKALEKLVEEENAIRDDESSGTSTTSVVDLPPAIGKKHALKKYDQFALNTSFFLGICANSRNFWYKKIE